MELGLDFSCAFLVKLLFLSLSFFIGKISVFIRVLLRGLSEIIEVVSEVFGI